MTMWRFIVTQVLAITLMCNESFATHEVFRVPLGLSPSFHHQHLYVQPPQQLVVYPQLHQQSMPQFYQQPMSQYYQQPQNLYIPQNTYSASRYIVQSTGGFYDPVVSYIHHQNPYQTSSFMNFNLGKKLFNQQPGEQTINNPDPSENTAGVLTKSGMEPHENPQNEQNEQEVAEMLITSDNSMETTEMLESMKDETNKENTTTMVPEAESNMKDSNDEIS